MIERWSYSEIPEVAPFLLEESYILGIDAVPGQVRFFVDFVLTPEHPLYTEPKPNEQFCYRRGELRFKSVERLMWSGRGAPPATDATGELDYGQFDLFALETLGFVLEGDFGHMEIRCESIEVVLE